MTIETEIVLLMISHQQHQQIEDSISPLMLYFVYCSKNILTQNVSDSIHKVKSVRSLFPIFRAAS